MGKKAEKARRKLEHRLDELSEQVDDMTALLQPEGDPFAEERAAFEASARTVRAHMAEVQAEIDHTWVAIGDAREALHALGRDLETEMRARIAEIAAHGVESLDAFESSLAVLREQAAVQTNEEVSRWSTEVSGRVEASLRAIDEQGEAIGVQMASQVGEILAAADRLVAHAHERARQRIGDAVESVEQLAREARDHATPDVPPPAEPLQWRPLEDLGPTDAMWDAPSNGAVDAESQPVGDNDDFFSRMAAELRDEEIQAAFVTSVGEVTTAGPGEPGPETVASDPSSAPPTAGWTEPHQEQVSERARRRPVKVSVPLAALTASTEVLARYAADERVRLEVVHVAADGRPASFLRLTAYNLAGWWEYHDVPAETDSKELQSAVVDLGELANALTYARQDADEAEVLVQMAGDLTIGNVLLLDQPGRDPVVPYHRQRIEHIDLRTADRSGLSVETQIGRVSIPPRLVSFLRTRNYRSSEIVMVESSPCLAAQIASPTTGTAATIIARLGREGASLHERPEERRASAGNEVVQLVRALSADTTADELEQILLGGVGYARRRAAAHPALPPAIIRHLMNDGTEAMRAAAAANPSADEASCALAASDGSDIVRAAMAANPGVTTEHLAGLSRDPVARVRAHAATNVGVTRELLGELAEDADPSVRAAAAAHQAMEPDKFFALANDPDPKVCAAIAGNPACPAQLLSELLALAPDAVLANPSAPASVLAAGSRIDARPLRTAVAANPATPVKQLQALARDGDPEVVRAVAENPSTPANVRRRSRRRLNAAQAEHAAEPGSS